MADLLLDVSILVAACAEQANGHGPVLSALDRATAQCARLWVYVPDVPRVLEAAGPAGQPGAKELLRGTQPLAALAEDADVLDAEDPTQAQRLRALRRLGADARLLTLDAELARSDPQALSPADFPSGEVGGGLDFIDLRTQQDRVRPLLERRLHGVLHHGRYIMGPEVREMETRLADDVGTEHCIAVASGTDALLIAMMALGVGPGDEVITTPFTFIATGEMIALLGAVPVYVDIDPRTYNLDPQALEAAITPRTRAIMPVSLYGQCADFDAIDAIAARHGLPVIEDGAQSLGATYKGRQSCALSSIGCTSFFPSKPLGCYGDGGACFTDDADLAQAMREIRVHGQSQRYRHTRLGVNGRMDTLQAAVVLAKLEVFAEEVAARGRIGARYSERLGDVVGTPFIEAHNTSVYAQYTIAVEERDRVRAALNEAGVPTAVHYPMPLHHQPALLQEGTHLPVAERAAGRVMSLPMHPYLSSADQDRIVTAVRAAVA